MREGGRGLRGRKGATTMLTAGITEREGQLCRNAQAIVEASSQQRIIKSVVDGTDGTNKISYNARPSIPSGQVPKSVAVSFNFVEYVRVSAAPSLG